MGGSLYISYHGCQQRKFQISDEIFLPILSNFVHSDNYKSLMMKSYQFFRFCKHFFGQYWAFSGCKGNTGITCLQVISKKQVIGKNKGGGDGSCPATLNALRARYSNKLLSKTREREIILNLCLNDIYCLCQQTKHFDRHFCKVLNYHLLALSISLHLALFQQPI